jgi:hypothetical protein
MTRRSPAPAEPRLDGVAWQRRVDRMGWLVHASPHPVDGPLEPRLAWRKPTAWIHATDSVLYAVLHALGKRWRDRQINPPTGLGPALAGGHYRVVFRGTSVGVFRWATLHRSVLDRIDLQEPVWLHVCAREGFILRRRGVLPRLSGGLMHSHCEWVADRPVRPLWRVPVGVLDLGVTLRVHEGARTTSALLAGWPWACRLPSTKPAQCVAAQDAVTRESGQ